MLSNFKMCIVPTNQDLTNYNQNGHFFSGSKPVDQNVHEHNFGVVGLCSNCVPQNHPSLLRILSMSFNIFNQPCLDQT